MVQYNPQLVPVLKEKAKYLKEKIMPIKQALRHTQKSQRTSEYKG